MKVYWGDLHSHCGVSYGSGTPERAIANARKHLDFCSMTGHAFWPDIPVDDPRLRYDAGIEKHLGGFAKLQLNWDDLLKLQRRHNVRGRFVTFPSYEWHSLEFGDHNCYFNAGNVPLIDAPDLKKLAAKLRCRNADFMMVPHHVGYICGGRGLNWAHFDERVSPLIEIFSSHGCGEADDAPYDYYHSMGARCAESMVRSGLVAGHRFGFCGGTDGHDGYPGHYGHGRTGIIASRLDRATLWTAMKERRVIASTGARIIADVQLDAAGIGQVAAISDRMTLGVRVEGTAPIDKVELIEGSKGAWRLRRLPTPDMRPDFEAGRYKVKIEMGWGVKDLRSSWHVRARVVRGKLLGIDPCFRFSAYDQSETEPCDAVLGFDDRKAEWICQAKQNPASAIAGTHFDASGTQAFILDIEAGPSTRLQLNDGSNKLDLPIAKLAAGSVVANSAGYVSPAIKVHRATPEREFRYSYIERYQPPADRGFVYVRITQTDGQAAWVSPIWYE